MKVEELIANEGILTSLGSKVLGKAASKGAQAMEPMLKKQAASKAAQAAFKSDVDTILTPLADLIGKGWKTLWVSLTAWGWGEPIYTAYKNISKARELHDSGDPEFNDAKLDGYIQQELAYCSVRLAAAIAVSQATLSFLPLAKIISLVPGGNVIAKPLYTLSTAAQVTFMSVLVSPMGRNAMADWLTGALVVKGLQIPFGPTYEKYVGGALKSIIDAITKKDVEGGAKARDGEQPPSDATGTDTLGATKQADVDATSTPPSKSSGNVPDKPAQQQWMDPSAPTIGGLKRNPQTGELELR